MARNRRSTATESRRPQPDQKRRQAGVPRGLFLLASLLFFTSGGTGLIYQVIWFKRFGHVWGSSSLAFAAVGGSFLLGLGLGAYLIGKRADQVRSPLGWYGICEIVIGLLALVIPFQISVLVDASSGIYAATAHLPLVSYLVQLGVTLLILGPPCVLMGGTLPLLIRQLTHRDGSLDQATGWLYAINTFGGAAGCYLSGFHLLPTLGMLTTNYLTAAVNVAIGMVSLVASRGAMVQLAGSSAPQAAASSAAAAPTATSLAWTPRMIALCVAAALSGCAALMLEMAWSRQLALVVGGSTYAYTATLFVVLLGIASGSLLFHLVLRRWASTAWLPMAVVGFMLGATLIGAWQLPRLSIWVASDAARVARGDQLWNGLICVGASCLVELIPAIGMGVLFPLFVHLTQASAARVGAAVGTIYAWNTAGSIVGATFTSILLFPRLGTAGTTALAAAMYVLTLLAMLPWQRRADFLRLGLVTGVGAAVVALLAWPSDPRNTNMGFGLYGYLGQEVIDAQETIFFREGASCNVLVTKAFPHHVSLRVNGKIDASSTGDMATQLGSAYLPRIFKPEAKEVLVIGYGSGCTPGHSLRFSDTHVTCCELEPAVWEASECFGTVNDRPHQQTLEWMQAENAKRPANERLSDEELAKQVRFNLILGDGRTLIQASDKKYDLIISEPSNPWVAGCSNLFTKEFFQAVKQRLNDDGVLVQWLQSYNFSIDDYLLIVRTLSSEFPYYGVMTLSGGADTLLMASKQPLLPNLEKLAELQQEVDRSPRIKADLDAWMGHSDLRWILLRHYMAGKDQLDKMLANHPSQTINTDVNLRLEFDAPLQVYRPIEADRLAQTALPKAVEGAKPAWVSMLAQRMGIEGDPAQLFTQIGNNTLAHAAKFESSTMQRAPMYQMYARDADAWFNAAARLKGENDEIKRGRRRAQLMMSMDDEKTNRLEALKELVALAPDDAETRAQLATRYLLLGDQPRAAAEYTEALRLRPELSYSTRNYNWANNLAWILATHPEESIRNGPEALRWAQAAAAAAADADFNVLDTLAAALAENGKFDEAASTTEQLIKLCADQPQLVDELKQRLALYRESKPYRELPKASS